MKYLLLTMIPAWATILWAISVKIKEKKIFDTVTLLICAFAATINGLVVYNIINDGVCSNILHLIQQLSSAAIVPMAYLYFSHQMGRQWHNVTTVLCWILASFSLLPNINIVTGDCSGMDPNLLSTLFKINIIHNGGLLFSCHIADLTILTQGILTVTRMVPAARTMQRYGLRLSNKMRGFYLWWIAAVIFILFTSLTTTAELVSPVGGWTYFIFYSFLICAIFSMLAMRLDLNPIVTQDSKESVKIDAFVSASKEMADKLRLLIDRDKVYLKPGYSAEDAATALGTNRTYFSRMMNVEFGMKFSELLNTYRIDLAKELLSTTDMSISDIAAEVGFSDPSYMNKKFKQIVGVSPHVYKTQN